MNLFYLGLLIAAAAATTQTYRGEARSGGELVYRELHTVTFEGEKPLRSETVYSDPAGVELGRLVNDYGPSLALPAHEMDDKRAKNAHGIRYRQQKPEMFNRDGEKEEKETLDSGDHKGGLLVGGQGLHYYLVVNLEEIVKKGKLPLKFVIPGRLDVYDFYLRVIGATPERVNLEIEIDNWILKLFAPKLELTYDRKQRRLLNYRGLSNLLDPRKKMMNVEINYRYD